MPENPYSRVYWSILSDPKFIDVYDDDRRLATWLRLLITADQVYPSVAILPIGINRSTVNHFISVGLIEDLGKKRYRIKGLHAEREMRSHSARNAALVRWQSEGNAEHMLGRGLVRGVSTRFARTSSFTPKPPDEQGASDGSEEARKNGTPGEGLVVSPRLTGSNPRANGSNPRAKTEAKAEAVHRRKQQRHLAYLRGSITEDQMKAMNEDDSPLVDIPGWGEYLSTQRKAESL